MTLEHIQSVLTQIEPRTPLPNESARFKIPNSTFRPLLRLIYDRDLLTEIFHELTHLERVKLTAFVSTLDHMTDSDELTPLEHQVFSRACLFFGLELLQFIVTNDIPETEKIKLTQTITQPSSVISIDTPNPN